MQSSLLQASLPLYPFTFQQAEPFSEKHLKPQAASFVTNYEQDRLISQLVGETGTANTTLEAIFELALRVNVTRALFVKGSKPLPDCFVKKNKLKRSVMLVPDGQNIGAFITRRLPIVDGMDEKDRAVRIFKSTLLSFNAQGQFSSVTQTVTFLVRLSKSAHESLPEEVVRRISIMQALSESLYTPKTYAYLKYTGKYGDNLAIYQTRSMCDLGDFLQEPAYSSLRTKQNRLLFAREVLEATIYMHTKGYLHKDLKAANFLVYSREDPHSGGVAVKISDFGLSRAVIDRDGCNRQCGTHDSVPPEFFKPPTGAIGTQQEAWGIGLVLYQIALDKMAPIHSCQSELADLMDEIKESSIQKCTVDEISRSEDDETVTAADIDIRYEQIRARWKAAMSNLPRPKTISTLQHIAQLLLQKDPEQRLDLPSALQFVNQLINHG